MQLQEGLSGQKKPELTGELAEVISGPCETSFVVRPAIVDVGSRGSKTERDLMAAKAVCRKPVQSGGQASVRSLIEWADVTTFSLRFSESSSSSLEKEGRGRGRGRDMDGRIGGPAREKKRSLSLLQLHRKKIC